MTDIPNCSNCSYDKTPQCPYDKICRVENYDNLAVRYAIAQDTNIIGCLSHPDARAYLMAPVIEKLEQHPYQTIELQVVLDLIKGVK